MIEMSETAQILNYATEKSLVIIDELGRGTSTSDGQSIALATLEKLHDIKAKTLFSTHFHQLTEIELPRVKNYHLDIIENEDGSIYFVRKLKPGSTDKSYGIHVAKLAGIPDDVIVRAFEILEEIDKNDPFRDMIKTQSENKNHKDKYYDVLIQQKRKSMSALNSQIELKQKELLAYEEKLSAVNEELDKQKSSIESLKTEIAEKRSSFDKDTEKQQKKIVQTSFFKPIVINESTVSEEVKLLIDEFKQMNIKSITPIDAMRFLMDLKERISKTS